MARTVPPLTRLVPAVLLLLAAAGAGTAALVLRDDEAAAGPAYGITYAVEDLSSGKRTEETVEVDPPLRSRRVMGTVGSATTEQGVYDLADGTWRQVAAVPPAEVGQDLRLTAALEWAAAQGLAVADGTGTVAGRRCTWWLTRDPLDVGAFAPATETDRARSCVDDEGRLLADLWRSGGRELRRRTATQVRALRSVDVFGGLTPEPLPAELTLTAVERVDAAVDDLVTLTAPQGLSLRAAARVSELVPGTTDVQRRFVRAVYDGDAGLVVVDQVRGRVEPRGPQVRLPLGTGQVQATGGGLVVIVPLGPEQALRVRSSLPYDDLLAWLTTLQRR